MYYCLKKQIRSITMSTRKKIVVNYENLSEDVVEAIKKKYPTGYMNHVFKVSLPNNNFFHAITIDTEDTSYLVKVKVKLDKVDKLEEELFNNIDAKDIDEGEDTSVEQKEDSKEEFN